MKIKQKVIRYLEETKLELTKVTWPNKLEVKGSTMAVVVTSMLISAFIFIVDKGLTQIVTFVLR